MPRIQPTDQRDAPELEPTFQRMEASMGFVSDGTLTLQPGPHASGGSRGAK